MINFSFNFIEPESGFKEPLIILKRVVFPAPLGPIKAVIEPFSILSDISLIALIPPKLL